MRLDARIQKGQQGNPRAASRKPRSVMSTENLKRLKQRKGGQQHGGQRKTPGMVKWGSSVTSQQEVVGWGAGGTGREVGAEEGRGGPGAEEGRDLAKSLEGRE